MDVNMLQILYTEINFKHMQNLELKIFFSGIPGLWDEIETDVILGYFCGDLKLW